MSTDIQTKMILIIGTNGTGKTTIAQKLINSIHTERKLIVTQHLDEWKKYTHNDLKKPSDIEFKGTNWHLMLNPKKTFPKLKHFVKGLLVFDDARRYMTAQTDQDVLTLYISRRQNAVHLILIGHGFTQIPPQAFTFCTDIILFATRDNIDSTRRNTVQNYEQLLEVQNRVNEKAKTDWHYYERIKY
jgi:hypothetical protein